MGNKHTTSKSKIYAILFILALLTLFSGCAVFNTRVLPDTADVRFAAVTRFDAFDAFDPQAEFFNASVVFETNDAAQLLNILRDSLLSVPKARAEYPVEYIITFYGNNKNILCTLYIKEDSSIVVLAPDGYHRGEFGVGAEFIREFKAMLEEYHMIDINID